MEPSTPIRSRFKRLLLAISLIVLLLTVVVWIYSSDFRMHWWGFHAATVRDTVAIHRWTGVIPRDGRLEVRFIIAKDKPLYVLWAEPRPQSFYRELAESSAKGYLLPRLEH